MIDLIITMIFVALVVSIWLLRNNVEKDLKEMSEERPPVVILTKNEFESERSDFKRVNVTSSSIEFSNSHQFNLCLHSFTHEI